MCIFVAGDTFTARFPERAFECECISDAFVRPFMSEDELFRLC